MQFDAHKYIYMERKSKQYEVEHKMSKKRQLSNNGCVERIKSKERKKESLSKVCHKLVTGFNSRGSQREKDFTMATVVLNNVIDPAIMQFACDRASFIACADGGANRLYDESHGQIIPNVIVGDLDSLRIDVKQFYEVGNKKTEIHRVVDQDRHDLDKTLQYVYDHRPSIVTETGTAVHTHDDHGNRDKTLFVLVLGALGGRFDHDMANINALYKWTKYFDFLALLSNENLVQLLEPGRHVIIPDRNLEGPTCGLIPIGAPVDNVTTSGLKWNLSNQTLNFGGLVSTSNRIVDTEVVVDTPNGYLLWTIAFSLNKGSNSSSSSKS